MGARSKWLQEDHGPHWYEKDDGCFIYISQYEDDYENETYYVTWVVCAPNGRGSYFCYVPSVLCRVCGGTGLPSEWNTAVADGGRPYYYDTETSETQWARPSGSCEACDGRADGGDTPPAAGWEAMNQPQPLPTVQVNH